MWNRRAAREAVSVLIESGSYFHLNLEERHRLIRDILPAAGEAGAADHPISAPADPPGNASVFLPKVVRPTASLAGQPFPGS
jgi:hypothetical protein